MHGVALGLALLATKMPGARAEKTMEIPPRYQEAAGDAFRAQTVPPILLGGSMWRDQSVVAPLLERVRKQFPSAAVARGAADSSTSGAIVVGSPKDHPALQKLVNGLRPHLPPGGLGTDGYVLESGPSGVLIAAEHASGAFYGVQRLLELAESDGGTLRIPGARIADWPEMRWRGMHVLVNGHAGVPALVRLITEFLPRYRMNQLIVELDYSFAFKSHPEVADSDPLTVTDCRHLADLAKRSFVRLVPMFNCLGHQSWAKNTGKLLTSHPEFDETPSLPPDNPGIYCRSWCPSHPDIDRFVGDLMDEVIDAFHADAFHVGMDEVFILGECARCKGTPNAVLFAKAVNALHAHLAKRKVEMMMWGDRLLDGKATGYGKWEASENDTAPAITQIPKDVVLCDWHYEVQKDYPSVDYLQKQGFRVWPSGWNSAANAQALAGCSLQHHGPRMVGYLATTWMGVDGVANALAGGQAAQDEARTAAGVAAAIRKGAQIAWAGMPAYP